MEKNKSHERILSFVINEVLLIKLSLYFFRGDNPPEPLIFFQTTVEKKKLFLDLR